MNQQIKKIQFSFRHFETNYHKSKKAQIVSGYFLKIEEDK